MAFRFLRGSLSFSRVIHNSSFRGAVRPSQPLALPTKFSGSQGRCHSTTPVSQTRSWDWAKYGVAAIAVFVALEKYRNTQSLAQDINYLNYEPKTEQSTEQSPNYLNYEPETEQSTEQSPEEEKESMPHYDYVLIGGGVACYKAIQSIRENDPTGTILLVCGEDSVPYERSVLSKGLWFKESESIPKELSEKLSKLYDLGEGDSREVEKDYNVTLAKDVFAFKAWPDDHVLSLTNFSLVRFILFVGSKNPSLHCL
jgi:hypothetical protein